MLPHMAETAKPQRHMYWCSYFDTMYVPTDVRRAGDITWCACPLHDARDRRPDEPDYDPRMPAWHPYIDGATDE